jgi:type I restriction enzyme S subunit
MSFPGYPKCQASGVAWLGEVPEHWEVKPLGRITASRCDGPFGSGLKSGYYSEGGALFPADVLA